MAFSADGKLLAASSDDRNMVVIWDRATGRKLREVRTAGPPTLLRFSRDAKRLYMMLSAWDVETGTEAKDVPRLPADVRTLGYSPDGREIFLVQKEEIVRWDIENGRELGRYPKPEGELRIAARLGHGLLLPRFDGKSVGMWDAAQEKELWSVEATRDKNYPSLPMAFSADGKLFAVEAPARTISVYEAATGKEVRRFEGDVGKIYYSISISPDGRTVAGSNWDGSLRLWNLKNGRERARIPTLQGWTTYVFFAPDSKTFATGGGNNAHAVMLWDTATGKPIEPFLGHTSPVSSVSFSPDGRTAATSSRLRGDPVVRLWDPNTGQLLRSLETSNRGVSAVAFSPDGKTLAAGGWYGERNVGLWDAGTGRERHALTGHASRCTCVAFSPDGKRLASGDAYYNSGQSEGRLCIWDVKAGKLVREIRGTRGAIQRVLFTPDGEYVLAAAIGVHIYEADTGRLVGEPLHAESRVWGLVLSPDGRLLATADDRGSLRLWELATRREIPLTFPYGSSSDVAFAPDGRTLAYFGRSDVVLFHWPSEETVGKLSGDAARGSRLVFSPDGRRLATAGNAESSVLIWDVARLVSRPLPAVAKPSKADLRRWWAVLGDKEPGLAYKVVWRLAAAPEEALPFLADSLKPAHAPEPAAVTRWIADLGNEDFKRRERASRELERLGEAVVDTLRKARTGDLSPEQAGRIDLLLVKLGSSRGREELRALRAVAALEQIGGPGARRILEGLAAGAPAARLTLEAQLTLQRLKRNDR